MQQLGTRIIETQRLLLRPFRAEDAPAMFRNWAADPVVMEFVTRPLYPTEEAVRGLLERWEADVPNPAVYRWAIVWKECGEPIGSITAIPEERTESAEFGWCIGKSWWGRGIMPEAAAAVFAYLFDEVGMNRLEARYDTRNRKSARVMQKLGMTLEGVLRQAGRSNAGISDVAVYSLLHSEYLARGGSSGLLTPPQPADGTKETQ